MKSGNFVPVGEIPLVIFEHFLVKLQKNVVPDQFDIDIEPIFIEVFLVKSIDVTLYQLRQMLLVEDRTVFWKRFRIFQQPFSDDEAVLFLFNIQVLISSILHY